ncbi:hypothetical protein C8J56DRAFT_1022680 [Mycena floridula]|nr:hypothetical protein C8J56DRAFT_1022680 [Mycena floridula]
MFAKIAAPFVAISLLVSSVVAAPITETSLSKRYEWPSFNNWNGISSFSNFDDFYGCDDFSGSQHSIVVKQDRQLVCHTQQITIIQQRLLVLQEMAKRIITEQICEVETQTVVFEQFHASLGGFGRDLRRYSGHQVGYDSNIASHYGDFYNSDGSLSTHDFGFSGHDLGSNYVTYSGDNWVDGSSHVSVGNAYDLARSAYVSSN